MKLINLKINLKKIKRKVVILVSIKWSQYKEIVMRKYFFDIKS